jgi:hypothetical protein
MTPQTKRLKGLNGVHVIPLDPEGTDKPWRLGEAKWTWGDIKSANAEKVSNKRPRRRWNYLIAISVCFVLAAAAALFLMGCNPRTSADCRHDRAEMIRLEGACKAGKLHACRYEHHVRINLALDCD